jgi:hypothetical protein
MIQSSQIAVSQETQLLYCLCPTSCSALLTRMLVQPVRLTHTAFLLVYHSQIACCPSFVSLLLVQRSQVSNRHQLLYCLFTSLDLALTSFQPTPATILFIHIVRFSAHKFPTDTSYYTVYSHLLIQGSQVSNRHQLLYCIFTFSGSALTSFQPTPATILHMHIF